jgi:hypothetical protein
MANDQATNAVPAKKAALFWYILAGTIAGILFLGCAGGGVYFYWDYSNKRTAEQRRNRVEVEPGIETSASGLALKYQDGYVDQVMVVSGQIHTIDGNTVNLVGFIFTNVSCEFSEANKGQVATLRINSDVKIKGVCTGKPFVNVTLKECKLVD